MKRGISRRKAMGLAGAGAALAMGGAAVGMQHESQGVSLAAFKDGRYVLPDLPYAYDALEPYYTEQILRLHHDGHHGGYVRGVNAALEKIAAANRSGDYSAIKSLSRALAYHGSGHVLHTLFWHSMCPGGTDAPDDLAGAMKKDFGSVKAATAQFSAATKSVEASGWGVLAYEPIGEKIMVLQAQNHQNLTMWGVVPLLVCDVWEHAYYLKYQKDRGLWVDNFMKIANWKFAAMRLATARAH